MRRLARLALLLAAAATAACSRGRPSFDDPRQPIVVRPGTEFELALNSNQSTGFQWVLADSAALGPLRLVGTNYRSSAPDKNGAGGTERWIFRAPSAGVGAISLAYRRPWESKPPIDSVRFRVTVR
jgi:inhibitor of cysteine peptidase